MCKIKKSYIKHGNLPVLLLARWRHYVIGGGLNSVTKRSVVMSVCVICCRRRVATIPSRYSAAEGYSVGR